ncbi:sulfite exporter TauE/SafE family protein [Catenuloplanes niger JCM 9533]
MLTVTVVLAAGIGVSLGLLGGGGSILAVPLLVYLAGLPAKPAIATSLLVVSVTAAIGVVPHALAGRVRWRTGLLFGTAGMAGAYTGGRISGTIPDAVLLTGFALLMLATAIAMLRGRPAAPGRPVRPSPAWRTVLTGTATGLVAGLLGAGGGFLIVPALVLLGGLTMPVAIGTSLLVIAAQSAAGLAGHLSSVQIPWGTAAAVTAAAVTGSLLGARLSGRVPATTLRAAFGWLVVVMGVLVLAGQLPDRCWSPPAQWASIGVLATGIVGVVLTGLRRRAAAGGVRR